MKKSKLKNQKSKPNLKLKAFSFVFGFALCTLSFAFKITPVSAQWSDTGVAVKEKVAAAITTDVDTALKNQNFFQTNIGIFLSRGLEVAIAVAALACLGFFLWGGLSWLTSGGDKAKYEAARDKITHALVGLVLVLVTWALWRLLLEFFGLNLIFQN